MAIFRFSVSKMANYHVLCSFTLFKMNLPVFLFCFFPCFVSLKLRDYLRMPIERWKPKYFNFPKMVLIWLLVDLATTKPINKQSFYSHFYNICHWSKKHFLSIFFFFEPLIHCKSKPQALSTAIFFYDLLYGDDVLHDKQKKIGIRIHLL